MMAKSMPVLLPRAKAPFMPGSMSPTTMSACSNRHHSGEPFCRRRKSGEVKQGRGLHTANSTCACWLHSWKTCCAMRPQKLWAEER